MRHFGCAWTYDLGHGPLTVCVLWLVNTGEFYAHAKISGAGDDLFAYVGRTLPGKGQDALDVMSGWENANARRVSLEWVYKKLRREYKTHSGFASAYMRRHGYHRNGAAVVNSHGDVVAPNIWHFAQLLIKNRVGYWMKDGRRVTAHAAIMEVEVLHGYSRDRHGDASLSSVPQ